MIATSSSSSIASTSSTRVDRWETLLRRLPSLIDAANVVTLRIWRMPVIRIIVLVILVLLFHQMSLRQLLQVRG